LRANIERLAGETGLSTAALAERRQAAATAASPAAAAAPPPGVTPGPNAADIAAAARMSEDERSAMIRSMVERLAERLQREPGDVDGWLRLGRAYAVLGDGQRSRDAYRRATEADPGRGDAREALSRAEAALAPAK
jgi:cytochrome c-type biogenesis protein CcmH